MWLAFFLATSWSILLFIQSPMFSMVHFNVVTVGIWNVHGRLLSWSFPLLMLSKWAEVPWRKWVTVGVGLNVWQPNPTSGPLQLRRKQAAASHSGYHRAHCPSCSTTMDWAFKAEVQTNPPSLPPVAPCHVFGLSNEKSKKDKLLVNMVFNLPQK